MANFQHNTNSSSLGSASSFRDELRTNNRSESIFKGSATSLPPIQQNDPRGGFTTSSSRSSKNSALRLPPVTTLRVTSIQRNTLDPKGGGGTVFTTSRVHYSRVEEALGSTVETTTFSTTTSHQRRLPPVSNRVTLPPLVPSTASSSSCTTQPNCKDSLLNNYPRVPNVSSKRVHSKQSLSSSSDVESNLESLYLRSSNASCGSDVFSDESQPRQEQRKINANCLAQANLLPQMYKNNFQSSGQPALQRQTAFPCRPSQSDLQPKLVATCAKTHSKLGSSDSSKCFQYQVEEPCVVRQQAPNLLSEIIPQSYSQDEARRCSDEPIKQKYPVADNAASSEPVVCRNRAPQLAYEVTFPVKRLKEIREPSRVQQQPRGGSDLRGLQGDTQGVPKGVSQGGVPQNTLPKKTCQTIINESEIPESIREYLKPKPVPNETLCADKESSSCRGKPCSGGHDSSSNMHLEMGRLLNGCFNSPLHHEHDEEERLLTSLDTPEHHTLLLAGPRLIPHPLHPELGARTARTPDVNALARGSSTSLSGPGSGSGSDSRGSFGHLGARGSSSSCTSSRAASAVSASLAPAACSAAMRELERSTRISCMSNQVVLPQQECLQELQSSPRLGLEEEVDDDYDEETGISTLQCCWLECEAIFPDQESLVRHIERIHVMEARRGSEEFSCLWKGCPRRFRPFNARYKLLIHMRVHSGEKPNKCPYEGCQKAFSRLENLKIHQRSHTGERPYNCQFTGCPKAFSNSSDRAKHQRTHFDTKPYACQVEGCNKRYTDPSSLRKHVKNHSVPEQVYARKKHRGEQVTSGGPPPPNRAPVIKQAPTPLPPAETLLKECNFSPLPPQHSDYGLIMESYSNMGVQQVLDDYVNECTADTGLGTANCFDDVMLDPLPFDAVRRLLGDQAGFLDSDFTSSLELDVDIAEQQLLSMGSELHSHVTSPHTQLLLFPPNRE